MRKWCAPVPRVNDLPAFALHLGVDLRDAELLLSRALHRDRAWLLTHPEAPIPARIAHRITAQLLRRRNGYPLAYLLGEQEFFGLPFRVTPSVLIPRPETELLVEEALRRISPGSRARVADIGTGSGCIAVTLAVRRPGVRIIAVDRSNAALNVARANARSHQVQSRVRFLRGNLLDPIRTPIDIVVANLPYLPRGPLPRHEPRSALAAGTDGLRYLRSLLRQLARRIPPPRAVLLEIDPRQARRLRTLVPAGYRLEVRKDLAGRDRLAILVPST